MRGRSPIAKAVIGSIVALAAGLGMGATELVLSAAPTAAGATCTPQPGNATAGSSTLTVNPATCLTAGMTVTISGSGWTAGKPGAFSECNGTPGQPTISVGGNPIAVSCGNPIPNLAVVGKNGNISGTLKVVAGTVGPPAAGADSAGNDGSADAAKYPCPADPTTGAGCTIGFGDSLTHNATVPITFAVTGGGTPPPTTSGGSGAATNNASSTSAPTGSTSAGSGSTSPSGATAAAGTSAAGSAGTSAAGSAGTTAATGGAVAAAPTTTALTGPGTGLQVTAVAGVLLLALGGSLVAERPRRLVRRLVGRGARSGAS